MKKRTNLLALVLSITAITFTLFGCSSDTGQKKSIAVPGSATETGGGAGSSGTNGAGADQASAELMEPAQIRHQQMRALMSRCL